MSPRLGSYFSALIVLGLAACSGGSSESDSPPIQAQCGDGIDNDGDAAIDLDDAGCSSVGDTDESDETPPALSGLDQRPTNLTCIAPDKSGSGTTSVAAVEAFPDLPDLSRPVALLQAPGDTSRWFAVEQTGRVRYFDDDPNVSTLQTFIDVRDRVDAPPPNESGLLGMAFHPDFASNSSVFLYYTAPGDPLVSILSRFTSPDGGQTMDPASETVIIRLNQDGPSHNGGNIAFGPDGYLYVGLGDGGGNGDLFERAQDTTNMLGAILRIDVDDGVPYGIPADNPFAENPLCPEDPDGSTRNCPEIFAWGLRNPWRWSFDRDTGELWLADVGQNAWEEVNRIEMGGNYGWDCREASSVFDSPASSCATATGLINPVAEYDHGLGESVTGGFVYRGTEIPALQGRYVFGDFISGRLWALVDDGMGGYELEVLDDSLGFNLSSFGERHDGELYVLDFSGRVRRLVDAGGGTGLPAVPMLLSETGCVSGTDPHMPAAGMIPYSLQAPFWSDGASKDRWLSIPDGSSIQLDGTGDFLFPVGTVLMKHFRLSGQLIETRLLMRHPDGEWAGYSYDWNEQANDATLVQGGKVEDVNGQSWIMPGSSGCLVCHTPAAGFSLGLEVGQLNGDSTYPSTGRTSNQLLTLDSIGMFTSPLGDPGALPALPDPADVTESFEDRARSYLHTNCAQCHRPGGPTPTDLDLRFETPLAATNTCDAVPLEGAFGIPDARVIAPGDPGRSVLLERMSRRDAHGMPPLASSVVDAFGLSLVSGWILALTTC